MFSRREQVVREVMAAGYLGTARGLIRRYRYPFRWFGSFNRSLLFCRFGELEVMLVNPGSSTTWV
jgi:hypothetical protein